VLEDVPQDVFVLVDNIYLMENVWMNRSVQVMYNILLKALCSMAYRLVVFLLR